MHISPYFAPEPVPLAPDQIPRSGVHVIRWIPGWDPPIGDGEFKILAHHHNPHRWLVQPYSRTLERLVGRARTMPADAFQSVSPGAGQ